MRILIHGATNGSNFGDCLFAHVFYEALLEFGDVDFLKKPRFGLCDYLAREIKNYKSSFKAKDADCLVYMSGGYFGDTTNSWKEAVVRYFRYFSVAKHFIKNSKPIYVCGVGGGPVNNRFLRKRMIQILNYADFVSFRDQETADYFVQNGLTNKVFVTTDTALSIKGRALPQLSAEYESMLGEKKNIFLHVYGDDNYNVELEEKILPALNRFLNEHLNEYRVFVGTDNLCRGKVSELNIFRRLEADKIALEYYSTWDFCSLLGHMDSVITVKLHAGIVSALYNKSVLSFAKHVNKTIRFYKQIGYIERCKLLRDIDAEKAYDMMNRYMDERIHIKQEIIDQAKTNLCPFMKKGEH